MFTNFFYTLKNFGIPVSMNEWDSLLEALEEGMGGASLTGFYHLCRAILVKTEAHYDRFDLVSPRFSAILKPRKGCRTRSGNGWTKNCRNWKSPRKCASITASWTWMN
jgi:uncharacterized protein with von Willebrand factor type A (vWA) domain